MPNNVLPTCTQVHSYYLIITFIGCYLLLLLFCRTSGMSSTEPSLHYYFYILFCILYVFCVGICDNHYIYLHAFMNIICDSFKIITSLILYNTWVMAICIYAIMFGLGISIMYLMLLF